MTNLNNQETLKKVALEVLALSRKADKRADSDTERLVEALLPYFADNQSILSMEGARSEIYNLVGYNSSDQKTKSTAFEMRVGRATKIAINVHFGLSSYDLGNGEIMFANSMNLKGEPIVHQDKNKKPLKNLGTVELKEGKLYLPSNALEPMTKKKVKGALTDVKNTDQELVKLSQALINTSFAEANPTASRKANTAIKTDNTSEMIKLLSEYLSVKIKNKSSLDCLHNEELEKLEAILHQYFEQRSTLQVKENEKDEGLKTLKNTKIA